MHLSRLARNIAEPNRMRPEQVATTFSLRFRTTGAIPDCSPAGKRLNSLAECQDMFEKVAIRFGKC